MNISNLSFDLSVYDIFGTFFAGAELVQVNEEQAKDPAHWYDLLKHENISVFNGVPGQMKMLTMFLKGGKTYIRCSKAYITFWRLDTCRFTEGD